MLVMTKLIRLVLMVLILAKKKLELREKKLEPKGYLGKSFEYNGIIDKSRWYFNTKHQWFIMKEWLENQMVDGFII